MNNLIPTIISLLKKIKLPKIKWPRIKPPKVKLPKIKLPNLRLKYAFRKVVGWVLKAVKGFLAWLKEAGVELVAQAFTLLGFFIIWLTLTGSARDVVGVATFIVTILWLITIPLRKEKNER